MQDLLGCLCGVLLRPHPLGGLGVPAGDEGFVRLHGHTVSAAPGATRTSALLLLRAQVPQLLQGTARSFASYAACAAVVLLPAAHICNLSPAPHHVAARVGWRS